MQTPRYSPGKIWIYQFMTIIVLFGCSGKNDPKDAREDLIIGAKIYQHQGSFVPLFEEWRELSINTVFVSDTLAAKDEFRSLARKHHITTFVICPIFYDPDPEFPAITDSGEEAVDEWVHFACPTRATYRQRKIRGIRDFVANYDPDGISIDFIRFFAYWEKVYPDRAPTSIPNTCFDDHCLNRFQADTKVTIPAQLQSVPEIAKWIQENHLSAWVEWKCGVITSMIQEIVTEAKKVKPDLLVNVHAVPWRQTDFGGAVKIVAGQDIAALSQIADYISPMCYHHMVKQTPAWIHTVVQDMNRHADAPILPSIQVGTAYLKTNLTTENFRQALLESLRTPSQGVVFWNWKALEAEPEKRKVVQTVLKKAELM